MNKKGGAGRGGRRSGQGKGRWVQERPTVQYREDVASPTWPDLYSTHCLQLLQGPGSGRVK